MMIVTHSLRTPAQTSRPRKMKLFGYKLVVDLNYSVVTQIVGVALAAQLVRLCYLLFRSYHLANIERQSAADDASDKKKK